MKRQEGDTAYEESIPDNCDPAHHGRDNNWGVGSGRHGYIDLYHNRGNLCRLIARAADFPVGSMTFLYTLTNPTGNTSPINGFTLDFPGVPTSDFVVTQSPVGWVNGVIAPDNQIDWKWVDFANPGEQLNPGQSFQFAFTTALPVGADNSADCFGPKRSRFQRGNLRTCLHRS